MKTYYSGNTAKSYNRVWKGFSEKTLAATRSAIDFTQLRAIVVAQDRPLRILDVACGTGLLLHSLASHLPDAELYGVDASQDMLEQARLLLENHAHVQFVQASLIAENSAGLPYQSAFFDLITCSNAFHYLKEPDTVLRGLAHLLAPQGQLIIEDYSRREFPFPWRIFEWLIKRIDPQHVRAYTMAEAQNVCQSAGLQVVAAHPFPIDRLWRGWVIRTIDATLHT